MFPPPGSGEAAAWDGAEASGAGLSLGPAKSDIRVSYVPTRQVEMKWGLEEGSGRWEGGQQDDDAGDDHYSS